MAAPRKKPEPQYHRINNIQAQGNARKFITVDRLDIEVFEVMQEAIKAHTGQAISYSLLVRMAMTRLADEVDRKVAKAGSEDKAKRSAWSLVHEAASINHRPEYRY